MENKRKTHIKQEQNIKKIELFLKKQEQNDRNIKPNSATRRYV
jgi:hypothetical protein